MIERQVITTWYKPEEKTPKPGIIMIATVSEKGDHMTYDHALCLCEWDDADGWLLEDAKLDQFTVHAWCDLEPYGGGRD